MQEILQRLVNRNEPRTEAMIQSDVRQFILTDPFQLNEGQIESVTMESPLGDRRRIDVEVGSTVFEVKKDLRVSSVLKNAIQQLAGYVETRQSQTARRYVGVLTDGADWRCYHLIDGELYEASVLHLETAKSPLDELTVWLEGVLATAQHITPTSTEIKARLGADSSAYALDKASLLALYRKHCGEPTVKLKRTLWSRLLTSALGTHFQDDDELFIEHTLLVDSAEIIAHALLGLDVEALAPTSILLGTKFDESGIFGVVEQDFFDWTLEVDGGPTFIRSLAKRLARFDWSAVNEDVLKVLYESVIGPETRRRLGEYYTPDWLAERLITEVLTDPINQRILDPACGSGTFLFHAVRKHLDQAESSGQTVSQALDGVTANVYGMDLHPVAVTLARVTYLLAIGKNRLLDPSRGTIQIPVYLGDSMQWQSQEASLFSEGNLVVPVDDDAQLFAEHLMFPDSLLDDTSSFDQLISELSKKASARAPDDPVPSLSSVFQRYGIAETDKSMLRNTFKIMCSLHDQRRDHIWGYYIRNLARPLWLAKLQQRVDLLIGNPPWLAYRHMTTEMQSTFRAMSESRGLWHGAELATHQDLSALFVSRCIQLYAKSDGRFAMIMPNAVVDREQYSGFRSGHYPDAKEPLDVSFDTSWDLRRIRPHFFPRGSSVVFGTRSKKPGKMPSKLSVWRGRITKNNARWENVANDLQSDAGEAAIGGKAGSPYRARFTNGATFIPYCLFFVDEKGSGPLGLTAGKSRVRAASSPYEKSPWKDLPRLEGVIESEYIRLVLSGEHLLPYRTTTPLTAVVPVLKGKLIHPDDELLEMYPGLMKWWQYSAQVWLENRISDRMTLDERLNYQNNLTKQIPVPSLRIVYNASGMHVYAAKISDQSVLINNALYWATARSHDEADFVCAILNSPITTELVRPYMPYSKDERHVHKHVWNLAIPEFDATDPTHMKLVSLSQAATELVSSIDVNGIHFVRARQIIRAEFDKSDICREISDIVYELIS